MSVGDAVEVCEHLQLLLPLDCIQGSCHPSLVLESLSELPEPRLPIVSGLAAPNILDPHYLQEAVPVWVVLHSIAQLPRSQRIGVYTKHGIEYDPRRGRALIDQACVDELSFLVRAHTPFVADRGLGCSVPTPNATLTIQAIRDGVALSCWSSGLRSSSRCQAPPCIALQAILASATPAW